MAQGSRQDRYQHFFYRTFTISLSILLLSETIVANTRSSVAAQQPPVTSSPSRNSQAYSEGEKLIDEALQLLRQGSSQYCFVVLERSPRHQIEALDPSADLPANQSFLTN